MYKLIGADGREYGPVDAGQLRQWLAEGRANAQSLVQAEGTGLWRPLAGFAELGGFSTAPAGAPPLVATAPVAARKSKIAAGLLGILLGGWGVHRFYLGYVGIGLAQIAVTLATCGLGALWGFIEGILILTGSINIDANGQPLQD